MSNESGEFQFFLLSVSQIDKKGGKVLFENGSATIYLNNEVVGVAKPDRGLYRLNALQREISSKISFSNKNLNKILHNRLGHLNMKAIAKLKAMSTGIDNKLTNELEFCDSCAMAKQSRL